MKTSLAIVFGLCTVVVAFATDEGTEANATSDPMHTMPAYKKGQDVFIRLSYDGSIRNWDAAITYDAESITIGNNGTLTITNSEGTTVTPKKGKLFHKFANVRMNKKFDALVNLAAVYELSKPGHYVVEWGCKNVQTQTTKIEIVEVTEEVDAINKRLEIDALTRIWHEDCGVPIDKIPTPKGFAISPAKAYYPYRATLARPKDRSQWHLFIDARNYYIVEKRDIRAMLKHSQVIDGTSGKRRKYAGALEHTGWPAGTVMGADKSNATHRMTLTFSIDGHTGDQEYKYLFRVLDKPSNLVISLPASGSHGDGGAGGYGLYVIPDPLSVFEDDRMSFKISFSEMRDGKKASIEETVTVPLLKEDSGKVRSIKYKTEWKALESPHARENHSGFLIDMDAARHKLTKATAKFLAGLVSKRPDEDTPDQIKLDPEYRVILGEVDYALEPDSLIQMHKGGTKIWNSPGIRNRVLRTSKGK